MLGDPHFWRNVPLGSSHLRCRRVMVGHQISTSVEKFASGKITAILLWNITMVATNNLSMGHVPCSLAMYDDCMILDVFWNIFWLLYYFVPDTVGYLLHISPCVLINPPLRFSPIVSWLGSPRNGGVLYCATPFLWDNYDKGGTLCPEKKQRSKLYAAPFGQLSIVLSSTFQSGLSIFFSHVL